MTGHLAGLAPLSRNTGFAQFGIVARMRRRSGSPLPRVLLVAARAVLLPLGCGDPAPSLVPIGPDIAVPADELRPVDRCMFEAGFRATQVHQGRVGSNAVYSWETTTWYSWKADGPNATLTAMANCGARFAPVQEKTVAELREIYDRWVLERQCLMSLGFTPKSPPSFEEFRAR